ncbi:MAG: GC-type dockerin domain-anchored protein [Phycisphaerales bacterium JB059]
MRSLGMLCVVLAIGAFGKGAVAQSSFRDGDLYLVSRKLHDPVLGDRPGVMRIDTATWAGTLLPFEPELSFAGRGAYDPYRDRLVLLSSGALLMDADGVVETLLPDAPERYEVAPTGDGRLYFYEQPNFITYVDEDDALHTLLDQSGAAYVTPGGLSAMFWDEGTNALFLGDFKSRAGWTTVTRLTLSPDGSSIVDVRSTSFDAGSGFESPHEFSRGPGGSIMLMIYVNTNDNADRLVLLDPVTLEETTFASPGYFGASRIRAGHYIPSRDEGVVLDQFWNQLVAYSFGESGTGEILPTLNVSALTDVERAQFVRIERACDRGADLAPPYGQLDFEDVIAFLRAFANQEPAADLSPAYGVYDFNDVAIFLVVFVEGCG